jgi:hypothetical protein
MAQLSHIPHAKSQQVAQVALSQAGISDDLLDQPSRQFTRMNRHDNKPISDRLMHSSVTASLPDKLKTSLLQSADQFLRTYAR